MKTLIQFLFVLFFAVQSYAAASVRLYFIDPFTGSKDTNVFYITPIGTNVLSNGGVVTKGIPRKVTPSSDGNSTNTLSVGHYSVTNRSLGSGIVIRVPDTSTFYDYTNLLVSGYNIFVTIENGEASTSTLNTNTIRILTSTNLNLLDDYLVRAAGQVTADGDWVFGGALSGDSISSWSVAADGDAEFNDIAATNITATSLAGPVLNQITNIASGSSVSAAQVAAIMATNLGNATLQNINQGFLPRVSNAIKSNLPVRILNIGDDQVQPVNAMQYALTNFLSSRTSGLTTGGSYSYRTAAGTYAERTGYEASQDGLLPVQTIRLGNGGSFTNASTILNGFPTTRIALNYYQSNNFGTITIQTQAFGGTLGTFRTVSANNSGALTYAYTNWDITLATNLVVSAVSSGTNIIIAAGQINTNAGSLWSWDDYESGNIALAQMTATAVSSNAARAFFNSNNWDVIIIHDINGSSGSAASNEWWTAAANFEAAVAGCNSDIVYWTPQRVIGANEIASAQRDGMLNIAKAYNRPLFDAYNVTYPDSRSESNGLYNVDGVHLTEAGSFYVTSRFMRDFGLSADAVAMLAPPIRFGADISGKANVAGGNNFTGAQTMNSTLTVGSTLSTTGSVAGLNFQNRTLSTEFGRLFASGNALYLVQSAWATDKGIIITNDGGKLSLYADPAFFWASDTPRLGTPAVPWWLVTTNSQLLGVTRYTHTAPAQIILPSANGVVTWCSNAFLYSIHNVGGTYTTNLIQGP